MNIETLRLYCLEKVGTTEGLPFGNDTLVFKVKGKLFALTSLETAQTVNLKCDPERAIKLREHYPEQIHPGYHMNKKHWNTVSLDLSEALLRELIDHSYELVVKSLKKADREALAGES
jgi:predicted DNA-binding protein (MmcQ/YjbR family)